MQRRHWILNEMKMRIFQTEEYVGMVLSYLRMEDMGNDLKFQWYPIGDIMRQAVRKYSQIFILKKIHLNFQDSRQMVLTDEKWLLFVIEQILSNALKYTSSDEVRPPKAESISLYIKGTGNWWWRILELESPRKIFRVFLSVDLPDITEESTRNLRESVCTCARRSYRN